ncbi:MAG: S26 family signal peptidase [Myxococcota bacterium]
MSPGVPDSLSSMLRKSGMLLWHSVHRGEPWPLLIKVAGRSMTPTLEPGDWLLVRKDRPQQQPDAAHLKSSASGNDTPSLPTPGEIVLVRHPHEADKILVKRVQSNGQKTFTVGSDNPFEGKDSRHFGSLPAEACLGYVVGSWRPRSSMLSRIIRRDRSSSL